MHCTNTSRFFKAPNYDPAAAAYAEAHKHPFAIAEALSASPALFPTTTFASPILVVTGANDFLFCNGGGRLSSRPSVLLEKVSVRRFEEVGYVSAARDESWDELPLQCDGLFPGCC
jgi:hypothetical protein